MNKIYDDLGPWFSVPESLVVDLKTLGNHAFIVWCYLRFRHNRARDTAWPGYERMIEDLGMGSGTIAAAMTALEEAGYLRRVRRPPRVTEYHVTVPRDTSGTEANRDATLLAEKSSPQANSSGGEVEPEEDRKNKSVAASRPAHPLLAPFLEMTKLAMPEIGPGRPMSGGEWQKRWEQPLRAILHAAGGDVDRAKKAMWEAIRASRNRKPDPLTIEAPQSILRMTRDALARSAPAVQRPDGPLEVGRY